MDCQNRLHIEAYDSWSLLPCGIGHSHIRGDVSTGLSHIHDTRSDTPNLLRYEDLELSDPDKMESFMMAVVGSHHEKSITTSLAACHDSIHPTVTRPPLAKRGRVKAASDHGSPLPDMMMDISGERRRAQNRAAQRAHRDRQKRYVAQLEKRFFALQASYNHLNEKYKTVQKEYEALISFVRSQQIPTDSPFLRTSAEPTLTFSSPDLEPLSEFSKCEQELDRVLAFRDDKSPSPTP
ncbi:hypothetical protein A1O7_02863 [Cladophialophora yegresii CBS 114405]|uniref:BZIP domain-containing protein n=1 Tax=Cladophialophora yegresii CBS 114405 TaxID=1182544 RepID=W9W3B3_9EURO|nr:uncharacterized protein A1O7_02863 [Cladophialophora yegresii CBS 114405]EXJ62428.1 hypothetical protein A1O7_02863 [Cladophialophora yegresii CBS 114405]